MKNKEEERKALQNMILDSIRLGYTPHLLLNNTMTNKLLEIKQTWIKENEDYLLGWGLSLKVIESIGDDIVKNAAQYAVAELEFAPDDMEQCCDNDTINSFDEAYSSRLDAYFAGHNAAIAAIIDRINQDLQSLNN